jgi:hypothetical protein
MCAPAFFVHIQKSSGYHDSERLAYERAARCSQCKRDIDGVHVKVAIAAHVVAYPLFNPCVGIMTFKTTCSKCNNYHNAQENPYLCGVYSCSKQPFLELVFWPCCLPYTLEQQQPPVTGASKDPYPYRRMGGYQTYQ